MTQAIPVIIHEVHKQLKSARCDNEYISATNG